MNQSRSQASCHACPNASAAPVVLLISGGTLANIVVNGLNERLGPITVIREAPESKAEVIKRRMRLLGWPTALGQVAFGLAQRIFMSAERRIHQIWEQHGLDPKLSPDIKIFDVPSVNSKACHDLLSALKPDVIGVYGTRILKPETLRAADAPFINYHAGINPKYRGQHPGYWALVSGDPEHAGVTIHLVDQGVDTGSILYQMPVRFTAADTIATYQHVQAAHAIPLFAQAINDGAHHRLNPKTVDLPSKQWFPPTLWTYMRNGVMRGVW